MKASYDILFGLGCAAVFIAVISAAYFIDGVYREWRDERKFFDSLKDSIAEADKLLEEEDNDD